MPLLEKYIWPNFVRAIDHLGPFEDNPHIGVAVSGGGDSLSLVFLLSRWIKLFGGNLHVFHVNHQLRDTSSQEKDQVCAWMEKADLPCSVLTWEHPPISTRLQERARQARYTLLDQACKEKGILHLVTGHHADDQKETCLMREHSGSRSYGLAGMSAVVYLTHCRLIRPLLEISKKDLHCALRGHPYLEDPSNTNPRFKRSEFRINMKTMPSELSYKPYQQKRKEDEKIAVYFMARHIRIRHDGNGTIELLPFQKIQKRDVKRIVLSALVRCIGQRSYFPSQKSVDSLLAQIAKGSPFKASIGNCLTVQKQKALWIIPDPRSLPFVDKLSGHKLWGKFIYKGSLPQGICVGPLGPNGWKALKVKNKTDTPYFAAVLSPAYWKSGKLIAAPFLNDATTPLVLPLLTFEPRHSLLAEFFV